MTYWCITHYCYTACCMTFWCITHCCYTACCITFWCITHCCYTACCMTFWCITHCCYTARARVFLLLTLCHGAGRVWPVTQGMWSTIYARAIWQDTSINLHTWYLQLVAYQPMYRLYCPKIKTSDTCANMTSMNWHCLSSDVIHSLVNMWTFDKRHSLNNKFAQWLSIRHQLYQQPVVNFTSLAWMIFREALSVVQFQP
jgi:hypothetical protein